MRFLVLAALAFAGCCLHLPAAVAHALAAESAMQICATDIDLTACDEMIAKLGSQDKAFMSDAYATRAIARISLGDIAGGSSDAAKLTAVAPGDDRLAAIHQLLDDRSAPQQDLKILCLGEYAPPAKRVDACTVLIGAHGSTARQELDYYAARARAHLRTGDFAGAQADIQKPLQSDPGNLVFLTDSIVFTYATGDYVTARQMAQDAMKKTTEPKQYALIKGHMAYLIGYHSLAIQELLTAQKLDSDTAETTYWVSLLRLEDHEDVAHNLMTLLDQLGPDNRLAKTAQFLLGKISADKLIADAKARPEPVRSARLCQAYFNIGHQAWLGGDNRAAAEAFRNAVQTNQYRLMEYQTAKMLLKRIDTP